MNTLHKLWSAAKVPLIFLCAFLVLTGLWFLLDLPPKEELIEILKGVIATYGLWIVLVGAFLEALLLVGVYFPGSIIIFLSVILAPSPAHAAISVAIVTVGLFCGYMTDYALGKYGWYRLLLFFGMQKQIATAQEQLTRYGARAIFLGFWSPGLSAFISTAAGVLHYPLKRFLLSSLVAVSLWDVFWGIVVYSLGEASLKAFLSWYFVLFALVIWVAIRFWEEQKR